MSKVKNPFLTMT